MLNKEKSRYSSGKILKTIIICAAILTAGESEAQLKLHSDDPLFPLKGKSMITISTGIPYVGIAEYSYGITDKFSVGVVAGVTPKVPGYGIRVRGVLYQSGESFRVYFRAPLFYYPSTKDLGGDPWILTWPVVNAEWKLKSGTRLSAGAGLVAAACVESIFGKEEIGEEEGFMGGVWNTFQVGISMPLTRSIVVHGEIAAVMNGYRLAKPEQWAGGPPVILVLGLNYNF